VIENFKVFGDYLCLYVRNGPVRDIERSWISSGDRFINSDDDNLLSIFLAKERNHNLLRVERKAVGVVDKSK
jgi:hypothetical protein